MRDFVSIKLDKHSDSPLYRQLGEALAGLITLGILSPDVKLPPIRTMARALKVNNATVVSAYRYIEQKGLAYSIVGSGTYVANEDARSLANLVMLEFNEKISKLRKE